MTILVTGGAGYIGSHMAHALIERGFRVVILDDLSTGYEALMPRAAQFILGDVGDKTLVAEIIARHAITAVAHFAGSIRVGESMHDPLSYYANNTANALNLIHCAVHGKVEAFLFSSTAAVYGAPEGGLIGEEAPLRPVSPYGWSKLMVEIMLRDAARAHGLRSAILRYFNVAGADPDGRTGQSSALSTHLIKVAVEAALKRRSHVEVFGSDYPTPDGTGVRDYIHVTDLIDAHLRALLHLLDGGESFTANCGYGTGFSVLQVIEAVKRVAGVDFPVAMGPRRAGDPAQLIADPAKICALLDWRPRYADLDTIIAHALAWEKILLTRNDRP